jgi:hypothetical protein
LHVKIIWGTEFDWKDIDFGVFDLLGLLLYGKFMQVVVLYIYIHTHRYWYHTHNKSSWYSFVLAYPFSSKKIISVSFLFFLEFMKIKALDCLG